MNKVRLLLLISLLVILFLAFTRGEDDKVRSNGNLNVAQIAGKHLFALKKCSDCHTLADKAEGNLTPVTNKRENDWFAEHVEQESSIVLRLESSKRKQRRVLRAEILALTEFLYATEPTEGKQIEAMPENVFRGAYLVYQNNCTNCHTIGGMGKDIAPDLSKVGDKHDKKWFIANLQDPKEFAPDTIMPSFDHLPEEDLAHIADYLETLRK